MGIVSYIAKLISPVYCQIRQKKYYLKGRINSLMYRHAFAQCGKGLIISGNPLIHDPERIYVGDNFSINDSCQLCPHANIYIGNNVTMSRGSQITSGGLSTELWKENRLDGSLPHVAGEVFIGDGTWLCINSIVLSGVKITGKGVIVAAGSVVTKDITEDFVVVGGVPAKIIKRM